MNNNATADLCALCAAAPAEVCDIEQGNICFACHDGLPELPADPRGIAFLLSPNTEPTSIDLP